jgi:hypothetical protein
MIKCAGSARAFWSAALLRRFPTEHRFSHGPDRDQFSEKMFFAYTMSA